jgi:hypothetical protein
MQAPNRKKCERHSDGVHLQCLDQSHFLREWSYDGQDGCLVYDIIRPGWFPGDGHGLYGTNLQFYTTRSLAAAWPDVGLRFSPEKPIFLH